MFRHLKNHHSRRNCQTPNPEPSFFRQGLTAIIAKLRFMTGSVRQGEAVIEGGSSKKPAAAVVAVKIAPKLSK